MPRALVTGAAGFIGGRLARLLLAEGWEVHALLGSACRREALADVKDLVRLHDHDGSTEGMLALVAGARPDVVFHLASLFLSEHRPDQVEELVRSNVLLGTQLLEALAACGGGRFLNTGTSWQHFGTPDYRPVNLYAATKQAFEDVLAYYAEAQGIAALTLKLYDTYGPGDPRRKLIRILFEAARSGEPIQLSPGEQVIELLHVDDAARAYALAAHLLLAGEVPTRAAYLLPGERLSLRDLVDRMSRATGREIRARWGGRPYRAREVMEPVGQGRPLPGWTPRIGLYEGLRACWEAILGEAPGK